MDRGAMIADIRDLQFALEMKDGASEILGFFSDQIYRSEKANEIAALFNKQYQKTDYEFSPVMITLREQGGLAETLDMVKSVYAGMIGLFMVVMSLVLWNAGLIGGLRRYGEIGVRLAIGEDKGHIYRSMLAESLIIGLIGSTFGTILGVLVSYYLQIKGIDISSMMQNASMLISNVMRVRVTSISYIIGFIPGLLATLLGTAISGIGIYKRQTSQLFKELEV